QRDHGLDRPDRAELLQQPQGLDLRRLQRDPAQHHRQGGAGAVISSPSPRSCGERVGVGGLSPSNDCRGTCTPSPATLRVSTSPRRRGEVKRPKSRTKFCSQGNEEKWISICP